MTRPTRIDDELGAAPSLGERLHAFDTAHSEALRRIWVAGDVHGHRKPLLRALERWPGPPPAWLVFVGDIDLDPDDGTFAEWLQPIYAAAPAGLQVAWIHGNHDADHEDRWERLQACGPALPLHGRVLDMCGVRVGGLGGTFQGRVWYPPAQPLITERRDLARHPLLPHERRLPPRPALHAAIYPSEWEALGALEADLLITHEAPSCHLHGFAAIDDLARALGVVRTFHGHHHEDLTDEYRALRESLGFEPIAIGFCAIKTGLGELVA